MAYHNLFVNKKNDFFQKKTFFFEIRHFSPVCAMAAEPGIAGLRSRASGQ